MIWQQRMQRLASHLRQHSPLPARLVWDGQAIDFGLFEQPLVTMHIRKPAGLRYLLSPRLDHLGEAYVRGLVDIEGKLDDIIDMAHALARRGKRYPLQRLAGLLFSHNRRADRQAIQYHYDVSNHFYAQWLDPEMVYSCAYFPQGDETLAAAQIKKIDHILSKVKLQNGHGLLDIGCGWGALLIRAARQFDVNCLGITLSQQQYAEATRRVSLAGLQDRVEIRLMDYRDLSGRFDRITSVGMFEHVGIKGLPGYFRQIRNLLTPDGLALNHGITSVSTKQRDAPFGAGNFIDKYVFPGGQLPHIGSTLSSMQQGGLEVLDVENLRRHYALTLSLWSQNYEANSRQIRQEIGEQRYRIWRIYLAGCAYAFRNDVISIYQILCQPAGRHADTLAWSREYMYG
ncbi:cyclopropane-fatty-acyl-phospholipid synthase [Aquitalea magnusonii]|uniref:Cyclopropane-fatty-acyl-phospholipid synthase n=1 Tax=Aquitalea magnusonii TaxID=332411 RepID=A0A3G9G9H6_9NEIS|nr:cyclopropane-fatty-acyl-phospholipid synthase family protein [Aquitalea magnusonii]BBF84195.1 cyclopropane-fatty-acyl-phospholipid synthase [Aquitalea magnusonii]